jgi:hypothetical protein
VTRWTRIVLVLLAFSPAVLSAAVVARYAVDVPVWDDLERATLLQKWTDGTLDWRYVYSPHIEHRMAVPRLITLASAALGDASLLTEQWVIFGVVVATALLIWGMLGRTFPQQPLRVAGLTFIANVLLFSPLQWETFLFSIQTSFVVPPFGLVLALWALGSRLSYGAKFALCFVAALLASNSFSHGILVWGVVLAAVALQPRFGTSRARAAFVGAWLLAACAVLVPHFTVDGYVNSSDFSYVAIGERAPGLGLSSLPERLPRALQFFGAILGSPLARTTVLDPRTLAPFGAAILLGIFGLLAARMLWRSREPELWTRALPWLAIGGYAVAAAIAPAIGRSAMLKWSYGLVPHYLTVSVYLLLADVVLVALFVQDAVSRASRPWVRSFLPQTAAVAAGALLAFQALQWGIGIVGSREWQSARLQSLTAMLYINHFEPKHILRVGGDLEDPLLLLNRLHEVGYMRPPLLDDTRLCHFSVDARTLGTGDARLMDARVAGRQLIVTGYARLPESGRRADGVLFTIPSGSGQRRVVASGELSGVPYADVPEMDHRLNGAHLPGLSEFAGFRTKIPLARLGARASFELQAWAVDSAHMRVRPFSQHVVVDSREGRSGAGLGRGPGTPVPTASGACASSGQI